MKIASIILLMFISNLNLNSQSLIEFAFPTENNEIVYKEVVEVDSTIKANELYINAKKWISEKFKSAKDVIQVDNSNMIVVRSFIKKGHNQVVANPKKWFTLTLEFKEGRYRYTLTDIVYEFNVNYMGTNQHYEEQYDKWLKYSTHKNKKKREKINAELEKYASSVNSEFELIISSLKNTLSSSTKNDDW